MKVEQLQQAGFTDAEIDSYLTGQRQTFEQAGFSDPEIDEHFGIVSEQPPVMTVNQAEKRAADVWDIAVDQELPLEVTEDGYDELRAGLDNKLYDPSEPPKAKIDQLYEYTPDLHLDEQALKENKAMRKQRIAVLQDFFGIDRKTGKFKKAEKKEEQLDLRVPTVADPDEPMSAEELAPTLQDVITSLSNEDLKYVVNATVETKALPKELDDMIAHEYRVRAYMESLKTHSEAAQTAIMSGLTFTNLFNLPEWTSRKGIHPIELVTGEKQAQSIALEASARVLAEKNEINPYNVTRIANLGAGVLKIALEFWMTPGANLAKVPAAIRPFVQSGLKFATHEALTAPRPGETLSQKGLSITERFFLGFGVGSAQKFIPKAGYRVPAVVGGFSALTYARTGDIEATIETGITVLGFEALTLMQRAGQYTNQRLRNVYADKAIKAARKQNPELHKFTNQQVAEILEKLARNWNDHTGRDLSHKTAREEAQRAWTQFQQGNPKPWQDLQQGRRGPEQEFAGPLAEPIQPIKAPSEGPAQAPVAERPAGSTKVPPKPAQAVTKPKKPRKIPISKRRGEIKRVESEIQKTGWYQMHEEEIKAYGGEQIAPISQSKFYIDPKYKGDIAQYFGERNKKGSIRSLWNLVSTDPKTSGWDQIAVERGMDSGSLDNFLQAVVNDYNAQKTGISRTIPDKVINQLENSDDPHEVALAHRLEMLNNGNYSEADILEAEKQIFKEFDEGTIDKEINYEIDDSRVNEELEAEKEAIAERKAIQAEEEAKEVGGEFLEGIEDKPKRLSEYTDEQLQETLDALVDSQEGASEAEVDKIVRRKVQVKNEMRRRAGEEYEGIKEPVATIKSGPYEMSVVEGDKKTSYSLRKEQGWEQIAALWDKQVEDPVVSKEHGLLDEYYQNQMKEATEQGYELGLVKFKGTPSKAGKYKNWEQEWQTEPVYNYWLQKRKLEPPETEAKARPTDLFGRPIAQGGAAGPQTEFLDKENFLAAPKDIEGQQRIDTPSENPNAYEAEDPEVSGEVEDQVDKIKKDNRREAGFAMVPEIEDFREISRQVQAGLGKLSTPQRDVITSTYGAIEKWRAETNKAGLLADWAKKSLDEIGATADQKKIVDDWLDNPDTYSGDYSALPDNIKQIGEVLKNDYKQMWDMANQLKIVNSWIEHYTPGIYSDSPAKIKKTLYPAGGRLGTKFKFAKQRKFKNKDEARAAGLHPVDDPILKNAIYKYQLGKVMANMNLIKTLGKLNREDGMPLIMGRPKKADKLRVWEDEYQWVNAPGLDRFLYVGEVGEKGMLIKLPAKADPEVAKALNDVFYPFTPKGKITKAYYTLRGKVKRIVMYNPLIHSWNIWSDTLDEVNFDPYAVYKVQKRGKQLYQNRDEIVEYAVDSGLNMQTGFSLAKDIRKAFSETPSAISGFWKPIKKIEEFSDKHLWESVVRNNQLGYFETFTGHIGRQHPDWSRAEVGQTAAFYINTLYGTLPHTWFTKSLSQAGSTALFARNWTVSNIDMVVKAVTLGGSGLGQKALNPAQRRAIGVQFAKHIPKGIFGLIAITNLMQLGFLAITNKMKKDGIIEGDKVPLHLTFQNESKRNWFDIDTGLDNKKGQRIFLIAPLFRYIRDYIGWTTEPGRTAYNKLEPLLKQSIEQIANYSVWREKKIAPKGAPAWERVKLRAKYFAEGITPIVQITGREGTDRTLFEFLVPFSGTWVRRGAPGGKYSAEIFKFREKEGYKRDQVDKKIDEYIQKGDLESAVLLIVETERYKSAEGAQMKYAQIVAPLNYYWHGMSKDEKEKFIGYLKKQGMSADGLEEELVKEAEQVIERKD